MELYILTFVAIFIGSVVHVTAGFSGGTIGCVILSTKLNILPASTVSTFQTTLVSAVEAYRRRADIDVKHVLMLAPVYTVVFYLLLQVAKEVDTTSLKAWFGVALIAIAAYSTFFSNKLRIRRSFVAGVTCAALSGVLSSFFGMGGPPMALYWLASCEDNKDKYIANSQFWFAISSLIATVVRLASGVLAAELFPLLLVGLVAQFLGRKVGVRIAEYMNMHKVKKLVSLVMAVSGLLTFVTNI